MTKTQNAIRKYGIDTCIKAYALHQQGEGAHTVGIYLGLRVNSADAAINAGRDLRAAALAAADTLAARQAASYAAMKQRTGFSTGG